MAVSRKRDGAPAPARRSVHVDGLSHGQLPIPAACRAGPLIATGGIRGVDRCTGALPQSAANQAELMFSNLAAVIEAAGGSVDSIVKVTVWVVDRSARSALDVHWVRLFPDENSRPARHLIEMPLPGGMLVQCEALALVSDETRW